MNRPILILLCLAALSSSALAADPAVSVHWYQITIAAGTSTVTFVGSSPLAAGSMCDQLTDTRPIMLENRREQFADPVHNLDMGWHPYEEGSRLFIVPRTVLYFIELPGDPAAPQAK